MQVLLTCWRLWGTWTIGQPRTSRSAAQGALALILIIRTASLLWHFRSPYSSSPGVMDYEDSCGAETVQTVFYDLCTLIYHWFINIKVIIEELKSVKGIWHILNKHLFTHIWKQPNYNRCRLYGQCVDSQPHEPHACATCASKYVISSQSIKHMHESYNTNWHELQLPC